MRSSKSTASLLDPLLRQLTALFRQRLDISILTLGSIASRGASSLLFWGLFALVSFFILLFLNIALAFALASWSESSPALGFLYLSAIYAGVLILLLIIRPWLSRQVRNVIARKTILRAKHINQRLDLIPYFRHQRYQSALRSIHDGGSYVLLEQARYQTLLLQDKTWPEFIHTLSYVSRHRHAIISGYLRNEALAKVADIPILGGLLHRLGYNPHPSHSQHSSSQKSRLENASSWVVKATPLLLLLWEVLRPSLTSLAIGKTQSLLAGLLFRRGRRKR